MGDMADFALDQVMDAEDDRFLYRSGAMSDDLAYELGIIDELGFYSHPPMFIGKSEKKVCKFCGKDGLHWKETVRGWRLTEVNGDVHTCDKHKFS